MPNGPFQLGTLGRVSFNSFLDGTSDTILVGEKHVPISNHGYGWWDCSTFNGDYFACSSRSGGPQYPLAKSPFDTGWLFGSYHPGICQFCFADGSVRNLPNYISPYTLGLLCDKADGQVIPNY
jgi:prepilin-type processing-associated H-X9-DG protein